jgi:hypothetical protein
LAHGLYGDERICRELEILNQIAEKHGLGQFFRNRVHLSKRCREKVPFDGSGINDSAFFLDASSYNLHNIFDASYAVQNLYQVYLDLKPSFLSKIIFRSIKYRLGAMGKGKPFPSKSDWGKSSD